MCPQTFRIHEALLPDLPASCHQVPHRCLQQLGSIICRGGLYYRPAYASLKIETQAEIQSPRNPEAVQMATGLRCSLILVQGFDGFGFTSLTGVAKTRPEKLYGGFCKSVVVEDAGTSSLTWILHMI